MTMVRMMRRPARVNPRCDGSPALVVFPIERSSFGHALDVVDSRLAAVLVCARRRGRIDLWIRVAVSGRIVLSLHFLPFRLPRDRILRDGAEVLRILQFVQARR